MSLKGGGGGGGPQQNSWKRCRMFWTSKYVYGRILSYLDFFPSKSYVSDHSESIICISKNYKI